MFLSSVREIIYSWGLVIWRIEPSIDYEASLCNGLRYLSSDFQAGLGHIKLIHLLCTMLRVPFLKPQKKPYSAITVQIDRLTSEQYEADDLSGIVDLIEVIRLQAGGPTEAARAIRKKLYVRLDTGRHETN